MGIREYILYIKLLDEGTDVYRITNGKKIKGLTFLVIRPNDYDESNETWEFPPGKIVFCRRVIRDNRQVFIAYKEVLDQ
jgi:hypothetical protein